MFGHNFLVEEVNPLESVFFFNQMEGKYKKLELDLIVKTCRHLNVPGVVACYINKFTVGVISPLHLFSTTSYQFDHF